MPTPANPSPPLTEAHPEPPRAPRWRRAVDVTGASVALVGHVLQNVGRLLADAGQDTQTIVDQALDLSDYTSETAVELKRLVDATPRLARIVTEVLKVVASYRLHQARCDMVGVRAHPDDLQALHRVNAERIYRLCVELRGALIKVGQWVSSRVDLLPPPWVEALSRLLDRVPAVASDLIVARVEEALGPLDERFADFDRAPLATASVAQVHRARLPDGREVVVKVRVPGVTRIFEADLRALRLLSRLLSDRFPQLNLEAIAGELSRSVVEELDFRQEALAAGELAEHLSGRDDVVIPGVVASHSTERVLTLAYLEGEKLVSFLEACEASGDETGRDRVLGTMIGAFFAQVLEGGLFHADPHPGNFLVLPGPRLGVLDFGCVMRFGADQRRAYGLLVASVLGGDVAGMADHLGALGFRGRDPANDVVDRARFCESFVELFHADLSGNLSDLDAADQMNKALTLLREQPLLEVPQDFILLARVFAAISGLMIRFKPNLNLAEIAWPSLSKAVAA